MKGWGIIILILAVSLSFASGPASSWVSGTGAIDVTRSVVDRIDEFEHHTSLAGDGSLEIGRSRGGNSDLHRGSSPRTFSLSYSGDVPLVGMKRIEMGSALAGTKTIIEEAFSANEIEKEETARVGSGSSHLVGTDTKLSFNGTYITTSNMHRIFETDVRSQQRFTGEFDIQRQMSFGGLADRRPSITIAVSPTDCYAEVGALVTRRYQVANVGTVPVQGLILIDSRAGAVALDRRDLHPGEVTTAESSFFVQQADLPGPLKDAVQVTGSDFQGNIAAASAAANVSIIGGGALNLTVTPLSECANAGDVVTYIYTIDNIGDLAITQLNLTDSIGGGPMAINATLSPGESIALEGNRTVMEIDLQGPLNNTVSVSGFNSMGEMAAASSESDLQPC